MGNKTRGRSRLSATIELKSSLPVARLSATMSHECFSKQNINQWHGTVVFLAPAASSLSTYVLSPALLSLFRSRSFVKLCRKLAILLRTAMAGGSREIKRKFEFGETGPAISHDDIKMMFASISNGVHHSSVVGNGIATITGVYIARTRVRSRSGR